MTWLKGPVTPFIFFLIFTLLSNCSDNQVDIEENNSEILIQNPKEDYTKQLVKAASPGWLKTLGDNFLNKEN